MGKKKTKYTKELLEPIVESSYSLAECLRKLKLKDVGGNYATLKKWIENFELNTSHFKGQGWNRGREFKSFEGLKGRTAIRKRLLKERGTICELCGLHTWMDFPIMIELHHIDGNSRNNSKENLQLLCPNCHATTDNWRNRKRE